MGKTDEDRYLVPGLMRGLEVLGAFTPERPEMSLGEIAAHLGLSRSAAFRTVYTLAHLGFLLPDAARRRYTLGPAVLRLGYGHLARRELVEVALPELERLRDETDWSTHLGVRDGRAVLYMLRLPGRTSLGGIVQVGSRLPASGTAMGRVLLADLDEPGLIALYRQEGFDQAPGRTPRSMAGLIRQWRADRAAGPVVQLGHFERGMASVAAPVRDHSGRVVAAINATRAHAARPGVDPRVVAAVEACADRISALLGAR